MLLLGQGLGNWWQCSYDGGPGLRSDAIEIMVNRVSSLSPNTQRKCSNVGRGGLFGRHRLGSHSNT